MAKVCDICSKGVMSGNNVSHSNRKTRTFWAPNVQKVKIVENGTVKSVYVCTRCLRSGKVTRAI
ncbi:MAG TPA: 50S ribosomal protein L28 [Clostridia bacterium]|nr:50S ribosomal protein L28 [Clostridia bacterium]